MPFVQIGEVFQNSRASDSVEVFRDAETRVRIHLRWDRSTQRLVSIGGITVGSRSELRIRRKGAIRPFAIGELRTGDIILRFTASEDQIPGQPPDRAHAIRAGVLTRRW